MAATVAAMVPATHQEMVEVAAVAVAEVAAAVAWVAAAAAWVVAAVRAVAVAEEGAEAAAGAVAVEWRELAPLHQCPQTPRRRRRWQQG